MTKKISFILLFSFLYLCACQPLNVDDGGDTRTDDRGGDPEDELPGDVFEGLSWREILKNCKPDVDVPGNIIDIGVDLFGLSEHYVPGQVRKCLEKKLEDSHNKICTARVKLERRRENARDDAARARAENAIVKLDTIQFKFNQKLYDMALKLDDELQKQDAKRRSHTAVGRVWDFWRGEETEALRDVLDVESYSECNTYNDDDDD